MVNLHFLSLMEALQECNSSVLAKVRLTRKDMTDELPYQRPDLIEVMEIEIDLATSTNVHTSFNKSVRECLDC